MASVLPSSVAGVNVGDPVSMLNSNLASALNNIGDAQFWEENISPGDIRSSLSSLDPSNPNATADLLRGMKWLLASISKGRDVSDFYAHVVKLVDATSLEARKMVYMYLVQYADHDATTRELSLLSINSFQRGLADAEQLIRALALRVLTSIRIPDILQIQILGVQKCAKDSSPYVRKCAANALAKLNPRCTEDALQMEMLLEIMKNLLDQDTSTMVLSSVLVAFTELCPDDLHLLHTSYRKLCQLLTDMDEWGQALLIETLARYCRKYFKQPHGWKNGTAEVIDRQRRIRRNVNITGANTATVGNSYSDTTTIQTMTTKTPIKDNDLSIFDDEKRNPNIASNSMPPRNVMPKKKKKKKKRIVQKGFYSDDEEEESSEEEEEVYDQSHLGRTSAPISTGGFFKDDIESKPTTFADNNNFMNNKATSNPNEDDDIHEDHRLLLKSSMSLLKSRNAGVVLAVCSLQYYCGIASINVRSSIGRALVRIHRDRREIQYVVLTSIKALAHECPSAFLPFLQDFFIKAMDPSFTRLIKLDILTSLALEPNAINEVLKELRTYIYHDDKQFSCAALRTVGKIVELARIVYKRTSQMSQNPELAKEANQIALNSLHGLLVLSHASTSSVVVGECVIVMQRVLSELLFADTHSVSPMEDPNNIQQLAIRRILLLLIKSLSSKSNRKLKKNKHFDESENNSNDDDYIEESKTESALNEATVRIPPKSTAAAIWIIGEIIAPMNLASSSPQSPLSSIVKKFKKNIDISKARVQIMGMITKSFPDLEPKVKEQCIHFASKVLVSNNIMNKTSSLSTLEAQLCEATLSMGRLDLDPDIRDRARHESNLIHMSVGLKYDTDAIENNSDTNLLKKLSADDMMKIFLRPKLPCSYLPLVDIGTSSEAVSVTGGSNPDTSFKIFRFGTLSSLVGHRARTAYIPLPHWAEKDSDTSLRDPPAAGDIVGPNQGGIDGSSVGRSSNVDGKQTFYEDSSSSEDDDGSSSSSSSSSDEGDDSSGSDSSDDSSSSDSDSSGSDDDNDERMKQQQPQTAVDIFANNTYNLSADRNVPTSKLLISTSVDTGESDEEANTDDSSSDESSSSEDQSVEETAAFGSNSIGMMKNNDTTTLIPLDSTAGATAQQQNQEGLLIPSHGNNDGVGSLSLSSSLANDFKGLVLEPVVRYTDDPTNQSSESGIFTSKWMDVVLPQHSGGLSVKMRYLRGDLKDRNIKLADQSIDNAPTTVCAEIKLKNKRTDTVTLRRLRFLQGRLASSSSSSTSSSINPRKMKLPMEIASLSQGQECTVILVLDFKSASDRDGLMVARLDLKFSGGSIPVEIKPSLGELLQQTCSSAQQNKKNCMEFDREMRKMGGFQRGSSDFAFNGNGNDDNDDSAEAGTTNIVEQLQRALEKSSAVTYIADGSSDDNEDSTLSSGMMRFVGFLPESHDPVYILLKYKEVLSEAQKKELAGSITVCCESTLALNSILNWIKRSI